MRKDEDLYNSAIQREVEEVLHPGANVTGN